MCVLLTGCADAECAETLLNRQQLKLIHLATPGSRPYQHSSYTIPYCQWRYHSYHKSLSSSALHWNTGPPEAHTAETLGSCLLETHTQGEKDEMYTTWTTSCLTVERFLRPLLGLAGFWVMWSVICYHHGNCWLSLVICNCLCQEFRLLLMHTHRYRRTQTPLYSLTPGNRCTHTPGNTCTYTWKNTRSRLDCMFIWWSAD